MGRTVTIFSAAAGIKNGWGDFKSNNDGHLDGGSRVDRTALRASDAVPIMDIPTWFADNVMRRRIPEAPSVAGGLQRRPPTVVMKLDIEGTDELVLAGLLATGALCHVDFVYTEWHISQESLDYLQKFLTEAGCASKLEVVDDETYWDYELGHALPTT